MANVIIDDTNLTNIANAIRGKNGTQNTYLPSEMATAITNIPSGGGSVPTWVSATYNSWNVKSIDTEMNILDRNVVSIDGNARKPLIVPVNFVSLGGDKRLYYFDATSNDVGDSILNHSTYMDTTGIPYYPTYYMVNLGGVYLSQSPQTPAPTPTGHYLATRYYMECNGASIDTTNYNAFKSAIESDGGTLNEKLIFYDKEGTILAVFSTFSDAVSAINNNSIDMSKGFAITSPFLYQTDNPPFTTTGSQLITLN